MANLLAVRNTLRKPWFFWPAVATPGVLAAVVGLLTWCSPAQFTPTGLEWRYVLVGCLLATWPMAVGLPDSVITRLASPPYSLIDSEAEEYWKPPFRGEVVQSASQVAVLAGLLVGLALTVVAFAGPSLLGTPSQKTPLNLFGFDLLVASAVACLWALGMMISAAIPSRQLSWSRAAFGSGYWLLSGGLYLFFAGFGWILSLIDATFFGLLFAAYYFIFITMMVVGRTLKLGKPLGSSDLGPPPRPAAPSMPQPEVAPSPDLKGAGPVSEAGERATSDSSARNPPGRWPYLLFVVVLVGGLVAPLLLLPRTALTYGLGVLGGVFSGFLIAMVTYYGQAPTLMVEDAGSEYDGKSSQHWVHLRVRNTAVGFLGAGAARECRARLTLQDGRSFTPKWKDRPNPIRPTPFLTPTGQITVLPWADPHLYEAACTETIRPRTSKLLDVAFRIEGDEACYISVPENFELSGLKRTPECRVGNGQTRFTVTFEYEGGESPTFLLAIDNPTGGGPGSLKIAAVDS